MKSVVENINNDNNKEPTPPPVEVGPELVVQPVTQASIREQIRLQKLLKLQSPTKDFRAFMDQSYDRIVQQLTGINLDLSFNTWLQLLSNEHNFREAFKNSVVLRHHYLPVMVGFASQATTDFDQLMKLMTLFLGGTGTFHPGSTENAKASTLIEAIDSKTTEFICSWPFLQRKQFFNTMLIWHVKYLYRDHETKAALQEFLKYPVIRAIIIDFNLANDLAPAIQGSNSNLQSCFTTYIEKQAKDISKEDENYYRAMSLLFDNDLKLDGFSTQHVSLLTKNTANICFNLHHQKMRSFPVLLAPEMRTLLKKQPQAAIGLLDNASYSQCFTAENLFSLANTHLEFAVNFISRIRSGVIKINQDHSLYRIATEDIEHFEDFNTNMLQPGLNLAILNQTEWWLLARFIVEALSGDAVLLSRITEALPNGDYEFNHFVNQLTIVAFEAGNCSAGLQLADNFWQGKGVMPNRAKAIEIYQTVCESQAELLTAEALNHMIEAKLMEFIPKYEGFVTTVAKLIDLKQTNTTQPSQKLISSLKGSLNTNMLSLCGKENKHNPLNIKFDPKAKLAELEKKADQMAEQLIASIEPILSLPIADLPQFKQHSLWVTAHMLMLRVLIEQKDLIANTPQWTTAFKRSLQCAWDYDALPDADADLVTILNRVKEMHKGTSYEVAIGSIRLDQHLAAHDARFFNGDNRHEHEKPPKETEAPLTRSKSMPDLLNPSHGLKGW